MRAPFLSLHILLATLVLQIECVYTFTFCTLLVTRTRLWSTAGVNSENNVKNDPTCTSTARCIVPQNITLDVLYEDPAMLVINKPSGMVMQFVSGSVESAAVFYLKNSGSAAPSPSWPWRSQESFEGIVHRIDKETSGVLVVAKHPLAARALHASFQERRVHKIYLAIAVGLPTKQSLQQQTTRQDLAVGTNNKPKITPSNTESPDLLTLKREIKKCGHNADKALKLINNFSDPNAACFSAAISACKRGGQRDKALLTFDSMRERGVTPDIKCFKKAISLCAKEPPLHTKAVELIGYMEECDLPMHPHCVSSAISACGRAGQIEPALELLRLLQEQSNSPNSMVGCFNAAISACDRCGATDAALDLKDQLRNIMSAGEVEPGENKNNRVVDLRALNEEILVDAPIGKMGTRLMPMGILPKSQGGREARSIVSPMAFDGTLSLNSVVIETGRTHQIRVHMASVLGCPLVGDRTYNRDDPIQRAERCMLHAKELTLPHPITGAMLTIMCPPPPEFAALARTIRNASIQ